MKGKQMSRKNVHRVASILMSGIMMTSGIATVVSAQEATTVVAEVETGTPPEMPTGGEPPEMPDGVMPEGEMTGGMGNSVGMGSTTLDASDSSDYFSDLDASTSWANAYIDYIYDQGIVNGTSDTTYSPNASIIRGDFALMLYRKYSFSTEGFSYGDVPTDAYYYQAVMRGKASGIFESTTYFYPEEAVTREQAAIWIYNAMVADGMPTDMTSSDISSYTDSDLISDEAMTAIATLTQLGIFQGDEDGNFNPESTLTRAQMAVVFYRLSYIGGGNGNGTPDGEMTSSVDQGTYETLVTEDASEVTYTSDGDQENAVRIEGDVEVTLTNIAVNKTAGEAGSGDTSNFYGNNAALLATDGAEVTIDGITVTTTAIGANGIFSYGEGTIVTVSDATVSTSENSSGGIMVTGGGTMYVYDSEIETQGGSSAALRTDRGGGTLVVDGGTYIANGNGSPAVYSTADVTVSNATLTATGSEAIVVEGKNSVTLIDSDVTGNMVKDDVENLQNVMIYQSMSGDADTGTSSFSMEGGSLTANNGDMIYVTNTSAIIYLSEVDMSLYNDVLLKIVGNDARNGWGVVGSNGGTVTFKAENQMLEGKIIVDEISSLSMTMADDSSFTGSINEDNEGGSVSLTIESGSTWTLTSDSYITEFDGAMADVITNGYTLFVSGVAQ